MSGKIYKKGKGGTMDKAVISVIVPIYNKEKYLVKCLESIINQTYQHLEIILVNDGSTDGSLKICQEYEKKDKRIKLISTKNNGAAHARNLAIDIATGNYISFIDADDYIAKDYYEYLLTLIKEYKVDIAECDFELVEEETEYFFDNQEKEIKKYNNIEALAELYSDDPDSHTRTVIMCNKLFKKGLFSNLRYIENRLIDDETIIYKLIYQSSGIIVTNRKMYAYVQSSNSTMRSSFTDKRLDDSMKVFDEFITFFQEKDLITIQEKAIQTAIHFYNQFVPFIRESQKIEDKEKTINKLIEEFETRIEQWEDLIKEYDFLKNRDKKKNQMKELFYQRLGEIN